MVKKDEGKNATISSMVKEGRLRHDLSQLELAKSLGYNYGNFIGMIEGGTAKFPREAVLKFANALSVSPEKFIKAWITENQPDWLPYLSFHPARK